MIQFERETWSNLDAALRREWLETNGLGGFASSTIVGLNTRRYHGLLVAATKPPVGRLVLLSKLEETLWIDGKRFDLSANRYPGVIHPQGFHYLKQFRLDPFPVFTYEVEGIEMEKSVFMIHGENSTVIHYELRKNNRPEVPKNLRLEIRPLITFRDYHGTTHENGVINPAVQERSGLASVTPYHGLPSLHLAHNAIELRKTGDWYRNLEYVPSANAGSIFPKTSSIRLYCVSICACAARHRSLPPPRSVMLPKRSNINGRKSHVAEKRSWHPPLRIVLPKASPLLQTNTWFCVAMRRRSSPATTGSATGVATP